MKAWQSGSMTHVSVPPLVKVFDTEPLPTLQYNRQLFFGYLGVGVIHLEAAGVECSARLRD